MKLTKFVPFLPFQDGSNAFKLPWYYQFGWEDRYNQGSWYYIFPFGWWVRLIIKLRGVKERGK